MSETPTPPVVETKPAPAPKPAPVPEAEAPVVETACADDYVETITVDTEQNSAST
jgi:hypothetical protein